MKKSAILAAATITTIAGCAPKEASKEEAPKDGFIMEHTAIDVADPVATANWWVENLGFEITCQKDDAARTTFIVDCTGRIAIELYRAQIESLPTPPNYSEMDPLTFHLAFISKDVDADIERLEKAGATLVSHTTSPGFDGAMMRDPSGIAIQFVKRGTPILKGEWGK